MSTSIWTGRVRYASTDLAANDPFDTLRALELANNALHYADSMGQVRVAYAAIAGASPTHTTVLPDDETFHRVGPTFGPWPVTRFAPLGSNRASYLYRVRVGGYLTAQAVETTYRVVLSTPEEAEDLCLANSVNVLSFTTSAAADAWIGAGTLYAPASQLVRAPDGEHTVATIGGDVLTTGAVELCATVWVSAQSNGTPTAALTALYLAEYVGT